MRPILRLAIWWWCWVRPDRLDRHPDRPRRRAAQVIGVDINEFRLGMARRMGAIAVNAAKESVVDSVKAVAGRKGGADAVIELSGAPEVFDYLFDILRLEDGS